MRRQGLIIDWGQFNSFVLDKLKKAEKPKKPDQSMVD
jgi:hypothetical protein